MEDVVALLLRGCNARWRAGVISITAVAKGLNGLGATGLDCGPVVSTDSSVADPEA